MNPATRTALTLGAAALLLTACGEDPEPEAADPTPSASSSQEPTPTPTLTPTEPEDTGTPLDGTWTVGPLTMAQAATHLAANGLGKWEKPFMELDGIADAGTRLTYTVEMTDGLLTLSAEVGDAPLSQYDQTSYVVDGDELSIIAANGCTGTFAWEKQGEGIQLSLIEDDCPPVGGVPDEVLMRVYYESRPLQPSA